MRATPAQEKVPDRHLVGRELWDRPLVKELVEAQSTVKDVALMDAEDLFQVLGRQGVDTQDGLGKARRKLLDSLQDPIHERRPVTGVRNVLYKELHDMATLRRDRFVQAARDRHLDDWLLGQQAPTALLLARVRADNTTKGFDAASEGSLVSSCIQAPRSRRHRDARHSRTRKGSRSASGRTRTLGQAVGERAGGGSKHRERCCPDGCRRPLPSPWASGRRHTRWTR
mmetsp:Transcript_12838/g.35952  ORF Transcript_12838/g.35952 Transcript_12838/m.35952 type:complete len:227 (-) Transcript_12838:195-875(-)